MSGGKAPREKGARYERDVVAFLRENGLPHVERRIMGMSDDRGDITGWPGVVVECKDHKSHDLASWVTQLEHEVFEAQASVGAVFVKRRRHRFVGDHYVVMTAWEWLALMRQAGYVE